MILRLILLLMMIGSSCVWAESGDDLFNYSKRHEEVLVVKVLTSDLVVLEDGRHVKLIGIESAGIPGADIFGGKWDIHLDLDRRKPIVDCVFHRPGRIRADDHD